MFLKKGDPPCPACCVYKKKMGMSFRTKTSVVKYTEQQHEIAENGRKIKMGGVCVYRDKRRKAFLFFFIAPSPFWRDEEE